MEAESTAPPGGGRRTRVSPLHLKMTARSLAKELVWWTLLSHQPGDRRDICVFATRRGGSTWIMELIAANRGIRPLNQPLETLSRNVTIGQAVELPKLDQGQITSIGPEDESQLHHVVSKLLSGEFVFNAPTKFWAKGFDFRSNRHVLKVTDAKPVIDWFDSTFDVDIVFLTRHPIPQALSCLRNRWTLTVRPFLRDERFVARYLGDERLALCHEVMERGTDLERFVLNWALENLAPLQLLPERPQWTHVSYEQCVLDPDAVIERLSERLGLEDREAMLRTVTRPSGSSGRSTTETVGDIRSGRGAAALERWKNEVPADEIDRCLSLLESLGADLSIIGADV